MCLCVCVGPGKGPPYASGEGGGGGSEGADKGAGREKRSAGERELYPPSAQGEPVTCSHPSSPWDNLQHHGKYGPFCSELDLKSNKERLKGS